MKVMKVVTLPASGGRYEIYRNGENTGDYRLQPHTASADIIQRKIDEPDAEFEYRQTIAVRCVATFEDVQVTDDEVDPSEEDGEIKEPENNGEHILVYTSHESEEGNFKTDE